MRRFAILTMQLGVSVKLLDLFCGAGGAAMGYHRAGFDEIVGVDIQPQPRYPFEFVQADALEYPLGGFDVIHASPPCQRYSLFSRNIGTADNHPDLIGPTRKRLVDSDADYVIENVEGAPLINAITVCGSSFGLRTDQGFGLRRHRLFESSLPLWSLGCAHGYEKNSIGVYGHGTPQWFRKKHGRNASTAEWREAMAIDWMTKAELTEAIPPAYCEFIGEQILQQIGAAA